MGRSGQDGLHSGQIQGSDTYHMSWRARHNTQEGREFQEIQGTQFVLSLPLLSPSALSLSLSLSALEWPLGAILTSLTVTM